MATHKEHLLSWFRRGLSITPAEAVDMWNNYRLADTVYQLRQEGHQISTQTMERINADGRRVTWARYSYICGPQGETPDSAGAVSPPPHNEIVSIADRLRGMWGKVRGGAA